MRAISVRQPWAHAILHFGKDVENRDWPEHYPARRFRGRVLLHASKGCTLREYGDAAAWIHDTVGIVVPELADLPRGALVGAMTIAGVVEESMSPWFVGPIGLVIENVVALPRAIPCKGALGYFEVPADVAAEVRRMAA